MKDTIISKLEGIEERHNEVPTRTATGNYLWSTRSSHPW
jgi:hypothetical protein